MEIGDIKEVANVGKMVYIDLGEDNCFVIAPKLAKFINGLRQKTEQLEKQIEIMKNCENCENAVWESNWMYSEHHCEQDNCNNYNKWEMKK